MRLSNIALVFDCSTVARPVHGFLRHASRRAWPLALHHWPHVALQEVKRAQQPWARSAAASRMIVTAWNYSPAFEKVNRGSHHLTIVRETMVTYRLVRPASSLRQAGASPHSILDWPSHSPCLALPNLTFRSAPCLPQILSTKPSLPLCSFGGGNVNRGLAKAKAG